MVFSSLLFLYVFLAAVIAVYYLLPKKARNAFLLIANLVFYFCGEPEYIILLIISIAVNYAFGLIIGKKNSAVRTKKTALISALSINAAVLCFFKYFGSIAGVLSRIPAFSAIPHISIPLPVGISFYSFQTMSYLIDVYRGDCAYQKNITAFSNYISLFPQLIAGPIVRYKDVETQLSQRKESMEKISSGACLFSCGLSKKVLVANAMGELFDRLKVMDGFGGAVGALMAAAAFAFQIYFDFSGYSDMARGLGRILGFEFMENFNYPYISKSVTEFWRRWHISLGTWFREYVYIPLGGNRHGIKRQIFNILVVWLLTGLWHGASLNFAVWGIYYAVLLIFEKTCMKRLVSGKRPVLGRIYAMAAVLVGWMIFAFDTPAAAGSFAAALTGSCGLLTRSAASLLHAYFPLMIIAGIGSTPLIHNLYLKIRLPALQTLVRCMGVVLSILFSTAALVYGSYNPFLYFRF